MKLTFVVALALSALPATFSKVLTVDPRGTSCASTRGGCITVISSGDDGVFTFPPVISGTQARQFQMALVQEANDPANTPQLVQDVNDATAAAVGIAENFTVISVKLKQIDAMQFGSDFATPWGEFRARYIDILIKSRTQASTVAQYAQDFETFLSFINPTSNQTDPQLITLFNQFSAETDVLKNNSDVLFKAFDQLAFDMRTFTGTFAGFAADKIKDDNAAIIKLRGEIEDLQDKMAKIFASMVGVAGVAGAGLIGTGIALAALPVFAPAILVGAGIAAGILLVTQAGLLTAYLLDKDMVADKNRQIAGLQNELGVINAANSSLTALAQDSIPALANQLGLFSAVWTGVSADATAVATWLSNGRIVLDQPEWLAIYFETPQTQYTVMVEALRLYASGLVIPS